MPAQDIYRNVVKNALIKDGWMITHDPFHLRWGKKDMYVDLGARRLIAAEREERKIAVEIKSFVSDSEIEDLRNAVGQFVLYRAVMRQTNPEHTLYLAIRDTTFNSIFEEPVGQLVMISENLNLIVFESQREVTVQWIP